MNVSKAEYNCLKTMTDDLMEAEYFIKYVILNYDENDTEGFETLRRMMRAYNSYNNRK